MIDVSTDPGFKTDPNNVVSPYAGRSIFVIILFYALVAMFVYFIILKSKVK